MKKTLLLSLITCLSFCFNSVYSQTTFASITSGSWGANATWETFPDYATALAASPGTGTAAVGIPSGTHNVLIRNGHNVNMGDAARGCKSIIIQSTGKLSGTGNTSDRRLQIGAGGTGFAYPLIDTVQVDGVLGGPTERIFIETGANAQQVKMFGSGLVEILRIRTVGGAGATDPTTPGVMVFEINVNINLYQASNYALSVVYNPAITDNYAMRIFPGKTVAIKEPTGTFHNSQNSTSYGKYGYQIEGTLDLSATTATSSIIAPAPAASRIILNVDKGQLKLGAGFRADTSATNPPSAGLLEMFIRNGGVVDATATTTFTVGRTTDGAGGLKDLVFGTDATSFLRRTVGLPTIGPLEVNFPVGVLDENTANDVFISGASDVFSVNVKNTFDNPVPNPTQTVNRQWTINKATAGATNATVRLSWLTAHQPAGFNPAANVVIMRYTGTTWESVAATVTGTGTATDPYIASASGFTQFSPFAVANASALPISFTNVKAFQKANGVQVDWSNATELNVDRYIVERSADGRTFTEVAFVAARSNRNNNADYTWFDASPVNGSNFYRIKGVEKDGTNKYTTVVKVSIGKRNLEFTIAPNPVRGQQVNVQVANLQQGTYSISVFNSAGQQVYSRSVTHQGGSATYQVQLPSSVKAGIYNLQLKDGETVLNKKLIVE